ncbi:MAG TPA: nucleotidyltransferase family protein [Gemmatimonadaceae bacterium]|nr:nucleotidyltransferase family protein [Gemmatimonadaceae bacterium]
MGELPSALRASAELDSRQLLLLTLCRRDVPTVESFGRPALLDDPKFRSEFLSLARRHRVLGLVLAALERESRVSSLPQPTDAFLAHIARLRREAALWDLERERVTSAHERNGISPVMLKGAALRATVYGEPMERPVGDLDLLVKPCEIDESLRCLEACGYRAPRLDISNAYREHHFHIPMGHPNGFLVEVHWALRAPRSPFRLDPQAFLHRSRVTQVRRGKSIRIPSSEDMLLHLSSQNVDEGFSHICRLVDVDRVVHSTPPLDWDYLADAARSLGLETALGLTLRLASTLLGTQLPDDVLTRLRLPRASRVHLRVYRPASSLLRQHARAVTPAQPYLYLWSMSRWRDRRTYLHRLMMGAEDPLQWLWRGHDSAEQLPARGVAASAVLKLLGYHVWLYLRATASLLTARSSWLPTGIEK